ncbi:unnamed protein product [Spirodela intermedia]|uniref:Uncharacterized protein n=2 Tax=Spirodela intermedia TaxID=51605 RepID=A0A7I8JKM3_SPIIN|nr:unnamed protein product [Spirodela intermedia]CAA6670381.1 unnamed protein product [Spirodela intermedia]CAA7407441.1 unnamed protein product [Spirodela intermedia]
MYQCKDAPRNLNLEKPINPPTPLRFRALVF